MGYHFICATTDSQNYSCVLFLQLSEDDSAMIKEMKQLMLIKVNEYYGEGCDMDVLDKAMLLDPRFKNVAFVSSDILLPELAIKGNIHF